MKRKCVKLIFTLVVVSLCIGVINTNVISSVEPATERTELIKQWEGLKYGLFIHFGIGTFTGKDIERCDKSASLFKPTALDVEQWIKVAKEGGMKYAVLTAKHTPGFCLWKSEFTDYDVETAKQPDVVDLFVKACRKHGLKPGLYYCIVDDYHKGWWKGPTTDTYFTLIKNHMKELLSRYPDLIELFVDIPWKLSAQQREELYAHIKSLAPDCLVLMNHGFKSGVKVTQWPTDIVNGENTPPPVETGHVPLKTINNKQYYIPMEVCRTILNGSWHYSPKVEIRSVQELYGHYQKAVTRGANFLLNLAPDKTGRIPQEQIDMLNKLKKLLGNSSKQIIEQEEKPSEIKYPHATANNIKDNSQDYSADKAIDGDLNTYWAADEAVLQIWLEIDMGKEITAYQVKIIEPDPRIKNFYIDAMIDGDWENLFTGDEIPESQLIEFKPIKARRFRLRVLDAATGSAISEFTIIEKKD